MNNLDPEVNTNNMQHYSAFADTASLTPPWQTYQHRTRAPEASAELHQPLPWTQHRGGIIDAAGNVVTLFCTANIPLIIGAVNNVTVEAQAQRIAELEAALREHHTWQSEYGQSEGHGYFNSALCIRTTKALESSNER